MENIGRNDPCPCGSGKKWKKCCEKSGVFPHLKNVIALSGSLPTKNSPISSVFYQKIQGKATGFSQESQDEEK